MSYVAKGKVEEAEYSEIIYYIEDKKEETQMRLAKQRR